MSTDVAEQIDVDSENETEEPVVKRGFDFRSKKVKIAALLMVVMAVEAAVIYLLVPQRHDPGNSGSGEDPSQTDDGAEVEKAEVDIGAISTTNGRAASGSIHVTFDLVAIVSADQRGNFEQAVNGISGGHKKRVREAVEKVVRSSNRDDLDDPNLGTIKRLIKEEVNKVLKKSFIIEVVISDFKTMEQ